MGWIKERIEAEHRKYEKSDHISWSLMSEAKIRREIREKIEFWFTDEGNEEEAKELIEYLQLNRNFAL